MKKSVQALCFTLAVVLAGLFGLGGAFAEEGRDEAFKRNMRDKLPALSGECIWFNTLYDWKAVDWYNLIIWAPSRKYPYHLELETACDALRFVDTIAFTSHDNRLCGYGRDSVIVGHDRCRIGAITKLDDKGLKMWLERAKTAKQARKDKKNKKADK
jgi:hypothetical protein